MDWRKIKNNWFFRFLKAKRTHRIFPYFWFISTQVIGMLYSPMIAAIGIFTSMGLFLGMLVPEKSAHKGILYFAIVIICVLSAMFFGDKLIDVLPSNDPYRQPLTTGIADIQIIVDSSNAFEPTGKMGHLIFANGKMDVVRGQGHIISVTVNKQEGYIFEMVTMSPTYAERINGNQIRFGAKLENILLSPLIGKPICKLSQAKYALLHFDNIPNNSKIISGLIICVFNGSLRIEIPVPSQAMGGDEIVIPEIQKYFLAPVKKEISYEIFTTKIH
jgi:hypothetical protein